MSARPHILVVNGHKVHQPVFVIGGPHSGVDLIGRALKRSAGFHVTIGPPAVTSVVYAFARAPSIQRGRDEAAAAVLRDAFAQAWQVTEQGCRTCSPQCRDAGGVTGSGLCADEGEAVRYGDASPDLIYCAGSLVDAFPDARLVQVVRDGRDVVAAMLRDPDALRWFRPGVANIDSEFPNPFFGIETRSDLAAWPELSEAGKCALRWRGSIRTMARLRASLSAEQLATVRYEQLIRDPAQAARALSAFVHAQVESSGARGRFRGMRGQRAPAEAGGWRRALTHAQLAEIEQVTGADLRRVGYGG